MVKSIKKNKPNLVNFARNTIHLILANMGTRILTLHSLHVVAHIALTLTLSILKIRKLKHKRIICLMSQNWEGKEEGFEPCQPDSEALFLITMAQLEMVLLEYN